MICDLKLVEELLGDVVWTQGEREALDAAIAEIRAARSRGQRVMFHELQPDEPYLHFRINTPPSAKNCKRLRVLPSGIPIEYRTKDLLQWTEAIQAKAVAALRQQQPKAYAEGRPLLPDEDVRLEFAHRVHDDTVDVLVLRDGPCPKGVTGRRRDVHNIPELVCDAIQRIAYQNDNQVTDLRVVRMLGAAAPEKTR